MRLGSVVVDGPCVLGPAGGLGSVLAVDVARRVAEVLRLPVRACGVDGYEDWNVKPSSSSGPATLVLPSAPVPSGPPLVARLAWLAGWPEPLAAQRLPEWRRLVATWAEEPSAPMSVEVRDSVVEPLVDGLRTSDAVAALEASLELGLSPGCLFETWVWADRLLALDLAADVGR